MQKTIEELKQMPIWLLWKKQKRGRKVAKIPFSADGRSCGTNDDHQDAWVTYEKAQQATSKQKADGVGFVIPKGMFFLDIDHRDLQDPQVQEILSLFNSYSEYSISGEGIHIYGLCDVNYLPTWVDSKDGKRKLAKEYYTHHPDNGLELYFGDLTSRFSVFTGKVIQDQPLSDCTDALRQTLNRYMNEDSLTWIRKPRRSSRNCGRRRMASNSAVFLTTVSGKNTDHNRKWMPPSVPLLHSVQVTTLNWSMPYSGSLPSKVTRKEGRSDSYLSTCRGLLHHIFRKAAANRLIDHNPVALADKMKSRDPVKKKEAFTADEVKLLMANLPVDRIGMSIRLMLGTGMRSQEILALKPRHIEEDGSIITIAQAINMVKGTAVVGHPKSRDSYRKIPVPPNLRKYAIALRNTDKMFIWETGKQDQPCNPSYFRDEFKKAIGKVEGVRVLTPHSCRHTYVSQMQALGVDLQTIQSIVGHADVDMTEHYLRVQEPKRLEAVDLFSKAFGIPQD